MSTHGLVARPIGDVGFEGQYNHSDSYPTWLGREVWRVMHERFSCNVDAFLTYAVDDHKGGWSAFGDRCYCHWKGREERKDNTYRYMAGSDSPEEGSFFDIQWVYVVHNLGFDVLVNVGSRFAHVTLVKWHEPEPDWAAIEAKGDGIEWEGGDN